MQEDTYHPVFWRNSSPTPHGRSALEDLRTAAHESGHAIARWQNGTTISGMTIEPSTSDGRKIHGKVWGDANCREEDEDHTRFFGRIVELVAGAVAEEVYLGDTDGLRGSDKTKARYWAGMLCSDERAIQYLLTAAESEAEGMLVQHRHVLDALADALCVRRTMSGDEVAALIRRVSGSK